jgi:hypothetical protein
VALDRNGNGTIDDGGELFNLLGNGFVSWRPSMRMATGCWTSGTAVLGAAVLAAGTVPHRLVEL